ncbi:MAG TPA: SDR family oxidoreductase [Planctomycetota bacterium]|nr:SDR family oxidoreductase [Planctomycetota bacterium]
MRTGIEFGRGQIYASDAFVRVEGPGGLLAADVGRQAAFLARNAQGWGERAYRIVSFALSACAMPFLAAIRDDLGIRALFASMRGYSHDRLDFLGQEYFERWLLPRLDPARVERLKARVADGEPVVLVSGWLDHVVRPIAKHLGIDRILCNRLESRDGRATGRLLDPIIPSRGRYLPRDSVVEPTAGQRRRSPLIVVFEDGRILEPFSVLKTLRGKELLLIGVTGFIGKVWLANVLKALPEIGKIHCLVRRRGTTSAKARFERLLAESPVLRTIPQETITRRLEVVEGDMCEPGLGLDAATRARLQASIDVIINSGGLTEFMPDVRLSLASNIDSTIHALEFLRGCDHASLLHLSTCYVAGTRSGRIPEHAAKDLTPAGTPGFDVEDEIRELRLLIAAKERESEKPDLFPNIRPHSGKPMSDVQMRKARERWLRAELTRLGAERARRFGWTNTYTYTKGLAEALLLTRGPDLPIAIVRPSIVESSDREPFRGWNEGVNTSTPLTYLLGMPFRLLPTRHGLRLDVVPVDLVTRGMNLIAAALVRRTHHRCYQLATSVQNPLGIAQSIELTCLAHRRHYQRQPGFDAWLRTEFEALPVSRLRYRAFSAPGQLALVRTLRRVLPLLALKRAERNLERVQTIVELYEPFIHDNDYAFEADHIALLDAAIVPEEREAFGYDAAGIDWPKYWIDTHIPALRRWSYPLIEGRPIEG